jgi:hypothetical protein
MPSLGDFHLVADARRASGPLDAPYGVSFRDDGENYYYFKIVDDGAFRVNAHYNGEWQTVIDWTDTVLVRPGAFNRLAVRGEGPHYAFYINGELVAEADSDLIPSGTAGVALELNNTGDEAAFEYDPFVARAP